MVKKVIKSLGEDTPQDWQAESDLRILLECEAIEKDSKRMDKVKALAKKKLLDLAGIASEGKDSE